MRVPRSQRAIGLGLLLPGLLLSHHGSAQAESRKATTPATSAAKKAPPRAATHAARSADRKPKSHAATRPAHPPVGHAVHVVRAGESISSIASRYRITRRSMIDANKLERSGHLRIGQRVIVPHARVTADGRPAPRVDPGILDGDVLLVRAGPRRVPTRLNVAPPESSGPGPELMWPVDGRIVSPFGRRHRGWHAGMDIKAEEGTPILAAAPGVVIASGQERDYGRIIRIEHDDGYVTVYAHNLENLVEVGDRVSSGTVIGTVGRTGRASAPHLHFEVRYEGVVYDPLQMLPARDVIEVRPDEADVAAQSARAHGADDDPDE